MDYLSTRDKYARAVSADDLTPYRGSSAAPLDVLGAAGMAAQRAPLGMLLQRLRADASGEGARQAVELLEPRLRDAVRRRQVRRDGVEAAAVCWEALGWWLDPTCQACAGVRYQSVNGRLLAKACPACSGSGKRAEPAAPAARWVIDLIGQQVAMSEGQHRLVMG